MRRLWRNAAGAVSTFRIGSNLEMTIPFVDLRSDSADVKREISAAVQQAIEDGQYILGDQVAAFEHAFAGYCGARRGIGLANGTEALHLTLRALGIGPGDEVITSANTFIATALAIAYTGATPVVVDVNPTDYLMNVELLEQAITPRTKAILPVHLYGQPADMPAIMEIAKKYDLPVVQDACQAHGALNGGQPLGAFGTAACYSFYPSKNLGGYGDGGMMVTNDDALAERVRMLRNYGQRSKNKFEMVGYNSRLDTLQAAILAVKLRYLDDGNEQRRQVAARYRELLSIRVGHRIAGRAIRHQPRLPFVRRAAPGSRRAHGTLARRGCAVRHPLPDANS